jgi:hypothetical protein
MRKADLSTRLRAAEQANIKAACEKGEDNPFAAFTRAAIKNRSG